MGKLSSYLSQVQDFIVNPESRNIVLNDLDAEVRERNLNDKKERPTEAVVLRVFPKNQTAGDIKNGNKQYCSAVLRIEGEHDAISEPASFDNPNIAERAIDAHGTCYSRDTLSSTTGKESGAVLPKVGDIVPIEYVRGSYRFLIPTDNKPSSGVVGENGGIAAFKGKRFSPLGEDGLPLSNNMIEELERKIPVTQGEIITFPSQMSHLTERIIEESKIWKGKKENDPSVYETLKKYWDHVGWNEPGNPKPVWTPGGVPWSAAFISWIVGDDSFPKSSAHYRYSRSALNNRIEKKGNWWLFSLKREKVKINIGDVFVNTRFDGREETYRHSHGDVVWKIENNIAYLAGGNVGQTMQKSKKVSLNSDGTSKSIGSYEILVKRVG